MTRFGRRWPTAILAAAMVLGVLVGWSVPAEAAEDPYAQDRIEIQTRSADIALFLNNQHGKIPWDGGARPPVFPPVVEDYLVMVVPPAQPPTDPCTGLNPDNPIRYCDSTGKIYVDLPTIHEWLTSDVGTRTTALRLVHAHAEYVANHLAVPRPAPVGQSPVQQSDVNSQDPFVACLTGSTLAAYQTFDFSWTLQYFQAIFDWPDHEEMYQAFSHGMANAIAGLPTGMSGCYIGHW